MFSQVLFSGIATGALYAFGAFGLVLIFKTTHVVNFAQGDMGMLGTFVAFTAMTTYGLSYGVSFIIALVFAAVLGVIVERFFLRPVQDSGHLTLIIITVAVLMIIEGVAGWIWGYSPTSFPRAIEGAQVEFLEASLSPHNLFIIGLMVVVMISIYLFFKKTMAGIAMRAAAEDLTTSRLMGINVNRVFSATWAVSSMLGALAGILIAPITYLNVGFMMDIQIKGFAAAVLGGFTNLPGAVLGGLILGVAESFIGAYISTEFSQTFAFILIVLTLWVKPSGLLGQNIGEKV